MGVCFSISRPALYPHTDAQLPVTQANKQLVPRAPSFPMLSKMFQKRNAALKGTCNRYA